jgi:hypothetical protein
MGSSLMLLQRYEDHGEEFLSRTVTGGETSVFHYIPESKAESMTRKHPHSPVKNKFKTVQSAGKVMATVFWDVHGVILVDFTPPGSTINVAASQETLKRLKEAIRRKGPGLLTKELGVLLLHDNARPHSESLELLGLRNSFTSTTPSRFDTIGLTSLPKDEKAPHRSALPLQ